MVALLSAGADPNQGDGYVWVVFTAILRGTEDNLADLLLHGANVTKKDNYGWTPLHIAIKLQYGLLVDVPAQRWRKRKYQKL